MRRRPRLCGQPRPFEEYGIPLPTDYASLAAACKAFDEAGIRGFTADYLYDYTCMETLQAFRRRA